MGLGSRNRLRLLAALAVVVTVVFVRANADPDRRTTAFRSVTTMSSTSTTTMTTAATATTFTSTTTPATTTPAKPKTVAQRAPATTRPAVSAPPPSSGALSCAWTATFSRDQEDLSLGTVRFVVTSPEIAGRWTRYVVGYVGPGDFPRPPRGDAHADPNGRAQMDVHVDMGNEGGTLTITLWPSDEHQRRCASEPYTVRFS